MNRYKVTLKNGTVVEAENKWLEPDGIHRHLCNTDTFIQIGDTVVAKNAIAVIQKIEDEKLEKEEEVF